jgi:hypothetical protein
MAGMCCGLLTGCCKDTKIVLNLLAICRQLDFGLPKDSIKGFNILVLRGIC